MDKKRKVIIYVLGILFILVLAGIIYFLLNKEEIVKINGVGLGGYYTYNSCLSEPACSAVLIEINFNLLKEDKTNCVVFQDGSELVKQNCPVVIDPNSPNGKRQDCNSYMPSYYDLFENKAHIQIEINKEELIDFNNNIPFFEICCRSEKILYSEQSALDKSSFECSKPYYIKNLKDLA